MLKEKEYPATHSMSTAWYCVDEDGNVGIIDIEDDGPVPVGGYTQDVVETIFWDDFSIDNGDYIKYLMLKPEQIAPLIDMPGDYGTWEYNDGKWSNIDWMQAIIKIDMSKLNVLRQALSKEKSPFQRPICLSKEQGLFYVDFYYNKKGIELLIQNDVIMAKYKVPYYCNDWAEDYKEEGKRQMNSFPFYLYHQDYTPNYLPAMRLTCPSSPLKIEQLPKELQAKIRKLPLKFKDTKRIQLAELMPVYGIWSIRYVYDNKIWWELASSNGGTIYYNESTNTIIPKQEMDRYINEGLAEEWDYHKHKDIDS